MNYYHGGCKKTKHISRTGETKCFTDMPDHWCEDHQVTFCKCGWEWGYHLGTESDKLPKYKYTYNPGLSEDACERLLYGLTTKG